MELKGKGVCEHNGIVSAVTGTFSSIACCIGAIAHKATAGGSMFAEGVCAKIKFVAELLVAKITAFAEDILIKVKGDGVASNITITAESGSTSPLIWDELTWDEYNWG